MKGYSKSNRLTFERRRRKKTSKFDPYINEISDYLDMGMTYQQVADAIEYRFEDVVNKDALVTFIYARGLKSRITMGGTNKNYTAPHCQGCDGCLEVVGLDGVKRVRVCTTTMRVIGWTTNTSPIWCEKRKDGAIK